MISIVMPLYNEEKYIGNCIESLLQQDYPQNDMEWIFVDGCSTDKTKEIVLEYQKKYPKLIRLYDNPNKTVPYAMNIGIKNSNGKYIIRLDAHAEYEKNYFSKCVENLDKTDADNVGGFAVTKARTKTGSFIAKMLSSKFGVGDSQFRINGKGGYVDTVPFGAFRREVFTKWGGFDERLDRNQDNEMNYRIRKNGGKIYLSNEIKLSYYCRDSLKGINKMARQNGMWNIIASRLCPGSMRLRHFVPLLFVLSVLGLIGFGFIHWIFWAILGAEMLLYFSLDFVFSVKAASRFKDFITLFFIFPLFHTNYGIGSLLGILKLFSKKYKKGTYKPQSI